MEGRGARPPKAPWTCHRGAAAVEFALVALPLIWVLGVICETGAFTVIQFQLQAATERAARLLRTNQIPSTWSADQFKDKVCEKLNLPECKEAIHVDVRHASIFGQLNPPPIASIGPTSKGSSYSETFDPGTNGEAGSLFITYDWKFTFPFMGTTFGFGNVPNRTDLRRIYGSTIYKHEMT